MIDATPPAGRLLDTPLPGPARFVPLRAPKPLEADRPTDVSFGTFETISGDTGLSIWYNRDATDPDTAAKVRLRLAPDRPAVIGRQDRGIPPYLDPGYRSTSVVPGTGQSVVRSVSEGQDVYVSRAHFMLRGNAGGIVLTNGVPCVGGGIRPPTNWTYLMEPTYRRMAPGEEYLIEHGASVSLKLPNHTVIRIRAE
jgi:hypothetical protein